MFLVSYFASDRLIGYIKRIWLINGPLMVVEAKSESPYLSTKRL